LTFVTKVLLGLDALEKLEADARPRRFRIRLS